jgi:deoxyribodipyrimidine photolyase-like uncharacterized protein
MDELVPDEQQREYVRDLLEMWRTVTAAIMAAINDPDEMDRWFEQAKADSVEWTLESQTAVAEMLLDGGLIARCFNLDTAADYRRALIAGDPRLPDLDLDVEDPAAD